MPHLLVSIVPVDGLAYVYVYGYMGPAFEGLSFIGLVYYN